MNFNEISASADYRDRRYLFIKAMESLKFLPYNDGKRLVTIGLERCPFPRTHSMASWRRSTRL